MAVLIDFSNIISSCISVMWKNRKTPEVAQYLMETYTRDELKNGRRIIKDTMRQMFIASLAKYIKKYNKGYGKIYICQDNKKSKYWRELTQFGGFPEYKGTRKLKKYGDDPVPWDKLHPIAREVVQEFTETFPYHFINVEHAEGDDVIAVLSKFFSGRGESVIIISEDKDMVQLQMLPHIDQYRPIRDTKHTFNEIEAHEQYLGMLMTGDRDDGIANIRSPHDIFMIRDESGKQINKQKTISAKFKKRAIEADSIETAIKELMPEEDHEFMLKRLEENKRWIGLLDGTPEPIANEILRVSQEKPLGSNELIVSYLAGHKQCEAHYKNYDVFCTEVSSNPFANRGASAPVDADLDDFFDNL